MSIFTQRVHSLFLFFFPAFAAGSPGAPLISLSWPPGAGVVDDLTCEVDGVSAVTLALSASSAAEEGAWIFEFIAVVRMALSRSAVFMRFPEAESLVLAVAVAKDLVA